MSTANIWYGVQAAEDLNGLVEGTMLQHVGIRFEPLGKDYIEATMPVDSRTVQPMGILHGGASLVLAETLASVGAILTIDRESRTAVGIEINANHVRSVRSGRVKGRATPLHLGRSTQVWEVRISNDEGQLVCVSRVTMMVTPSGTDD